MMVVWISCSHWGMFKFIEAEIVFSTVKQS